MDDSGSILLQISTLKDMLDKVNDEIEVNIQITREIESEIVKCDEIENALSAREFELIKFVYLSQFELRGLMTVTANSRNSVSVLVEEINHLSKKKDELLEKMNKERETFTVSCMQFQQSIEGEECKELRSLLQQKESLEDEVHKLQQTLSNLEKSVCPQSSKLLEDLCSYNLALEAEIQRDNAESEQLTKEINDLRATLVSTVDDSW